MAQDLRKLMRTWRSVLLWPKRQGFCA